MHPGSISPRPDPKAPIDRHSLTDGGLKGIYNRYQDLANVGGGSAKDAGKLATNLIDNTAVGQGREWAQKQFGLKASTGVTSFTQNGLQYSTNVLKVNTSKYAPSGRL